MPRFLSFLFCCTSFVCFSQSLLPHQHAHAHNDYKQIHPLKDALQNRFTSVEADVHLQDGKLWVSHNHPDKNTPSLEKLYLTPLDSLLKRNSGKIYAETESPFYLMLDIKTEAGITFLAIQKALQSYPRLRCVRENCPVKIFVSGNRPVSTMVKEGYAGIGLDGRPDDLGKGYSADLMPVISDHFKNWSDWNGISKPSTQDFQRIKDLAQRVHDEKKKLRLWAIPDNEVAWEALLDAGVDLINTDHLAELNHFLNQKRL
ncbi:MAG: hypothetical protein AABY93_08155 [Bacteroidota bacterium]